MHCVIKALAIKSDPFSDKSLGVNKRIGCLVFESKYAYKIEYTNRCTESWNGSVLFSMLAGRLGTWNLKKKRS